MAKYGKLKPYEWPQDKVKIPNGQGLMPRIETMNGNVTKKEGAWYTGEFTVPAFTNFRTDFVIPIEPDGDFWCNNILSFSMVDDGIVQPAFKINIIDIRTGFDLTYPWARLAFFKTQPNVMGAAGEAPYPVGGGAFRSTSSMLQPYCFTRNGGIRVVIDSDGQVPEEIYNQISFIGWKEYQFASR